MVVQPTDSLQVIRITPRAGNILFFDIYDEMTKETTTINSFSITEQSHYYNVLLSFPFVEGRTYTIKARGTNDAIRYYGNLFCTSQDPETYKILKDQFITKTSDNTFIVL